MFWPTRDQVHPGAFSREQEKRSWDVVHRGGHGLHSRYVVPINLSGLRKAFAKIARKLQ